MRHRPRGRQARPRRGAFLLPSLFTTGNLLLGFYCVVLGFDSHFEIAALLIFTAGLLDGLDGTLARLTGAESAFGRQYDSLADLITFGMAPAVLVYLWGLNELGRIGWLVPSFFLVCTATRLARYNVQAKEEGRSRYFVGLPAPAGGAALASVLFIAPENDWKDWLNPVLLLVTVALALLMVSTLRYPTLKLLLDFKRIRSYRVVLPTAAVLLLVAYHPPAFFVSIGTLYVFSGLLSWARGRLPGALQRHKDVGSS